MNEGIHVNGITLNGTWDAEPNLHKDLNIGFGENKMMNGVGSNSNSPSSGDNNTSSVSTMLESLRSNLSQIYSGENLETPNYPMHIKTESPVRGNDFCNANDENNFPGQHHQQQQQRDQLTSHSDANQGFDLYNSAITSVPSSTMQRQFSSNPYDTSNVINNALFSQQQGYPAYPVKPEPGSPTSTYQINPYYLSGNGQGIYPPTSMHLNQIDYQGYRLSDMMLPTSFASQDPLKTEKFQSINPETDPVLAQQLLGLNSASSVVDQSDQTKCQTDYSTAHHHTESVSGPMRIRRIKRPIPAGPSYPVHLWQFILELLGDHSCKDFIAWTGNDLEFKVINSRELARRWGRRKNNARMNFDKLSRAMRYYYEKNIIKHIPGQRLVYRYCRNPDDIVFTQLLKTAMGTLPPETRLIAPVTTNPHFTNTHSLSNNFNQLSSSTSHFGTSLGSLTSSSNLNTLQQNSSPLNTSTLNSSSNILSPQQHPSPTLSVPGLSASSGLSGGLSGAGMSEYMFSTNCLTQVQQHLQQSGNSEGVVKQHHMMAS